MRGVRCAPVARLPLLPVASACDVCGPHFSDMSATLYAADSLRSFPPFSPSVLPSSLPVRVSPLLRLSANVLHFWLGYIHVLETIQLFSAISSMARDGRLMCFFTSLFRHMFLSACLACIDGLVSEEGAIVCTLEPGFWRTSNSKSDHLDVDQQKL